MTRPVDLRHHVIPDFYLRARERHIAEVLVKQGLTQLATALGLGGLASHQHSGGQADGLATVAFPDQLLRSLDALSDGVDIGVRTTDLEPLVARLERLGNRIVVSVLAAAAINSMAELAAADRIRRGASRKPHTGARTAALAALGYAAWRQRTAGRHARAVSP